MKKTDYNDKIITEYSSFFRGEENKNDKSSMALEENDFNNKYQELSPKAFDALEKFILSTKSKQADAAEIMNISIKKGIGKVITAKNYVGVITLKDGTTINILPKIYSTDQSKDMETKTKKLVIDMIKTIKNFPYKLLQNANINIEKMNIFEIFIRMFIDQMILITKRGLKCAYETIETNETFFKGKMKFKEHMKYNYVHKERCYVQHDEFNANRVENRLLKTTLIYLYNKTRSPKNKKDIKILLNSFSYVDISTNYEKDFEKVFLDRNTKDYELVLLWSKIFLQNKSFTSFSGDEVAFALLFPMDTLFESYVAAQLKRILDTTKYSISIQDRTYYLFNKPKKYFSLRPDIVIKDKNVEKTKTYVMDTKWKILSNDKKNYGISQLDMYQMYVYQKKYLAEDITLIYPLTEKIPEDKHIEFFSEEDGKIVKVKVRFIDLFNIKENLESLIGEMKGGI